MSWGVRLYLPVSIISLWLHATLEAFNITYFQVSLAEDPVTSGETAAKLSFQELAREPLGCYSKRTSSTTYSNTCLWLGTKNNFVSNNHALLSWSSYTKSFTRNLDFSPYMFGFLQESFFREEFSAQMGPTKPQKFYKWYSFSV